MSSRIDMSLVSRQAGAYAEANPGLKRATGLYREVFSVQRRLSRRMPGRLPHLEGSQACKLIEEGKALIDTRELAIDAALAEEIMRELAGALKKKSEAPVEKLGPFLAKELEEEGLRSLMGAFPEHDGEKFLRLAKGYSIEPEVLYMLTHMTLAPFMWKAALAVTRMVEPDQVPRGRCPVCGDLPVMGFLRPEDGLRALECSPRGSRWGTPRIMCPFCVNVDQGKLKYVFIEGDDRRRAYLCEKCEKYVKVSMAPGKRDEEFVIPLEDLATARLDLAAEEKGCERGCRTVFS